MKPGQALAAAISTAALMVVMAAPAEAVVREEYGTINCYSGRTVATRVKADGAHNHQIALRSKNEPNRGYVFSSILTTTYAGASWTINGGSAAGAGYYDAAYSTGYCLS